MGTEEAEPLKSSPTTDPRHGKHFFQALPMPNICSRAAGGASDQFAHFSFITHTPFQSPAGGFAARMLAALDIRRRQRVAGMKLEAAWQTSRRLVPVRGRGSADAFAEIIDHVHEVRERLVVW